MILLFQSFLGAAEAGNIQRIEEIIRNTFYFYKIFNL